jgi:UDP-N-acetylglucosamine:LPS N-acetylglucosamine transferase
MMIRDEELKERLLPEVLSLIRDQERLDRMKSALKDMAKPGAAKTIAQALISLAGIKEEGGDQK